jgi:hypothetical protein
MPLPAQSNASGTNPSPRYAIYNGAYKQDSDIKDINHPKLLPAPNTVSPVKF